jgi:LPS-assembly protein
VDSRVRLDYRARRGVGIGLDGEYLLKRSGSGKFKTYYIHDKRRELEDGTETEEDRYRASLSHYQPWKYQTTLRGQFHKLSDEDILLDFFHQDSDYSVRPPSFFDLTKYHPKYVARFFVQKRVNDFFTEVERLPEVSLDFRRQRIMKSPFYYTSLSSLANLSKQFATETAIEIPGQDSPLLTDNLDAVRFDTYDEISYPKKYFGWLETNVWFGVRQTWYSKELKEGESIWRGSFSDGVELGTKIYKIWEEYENKDWNIHTLRHVIEPRVKYTYVLDPTVEPKRLPQFDQIDALTGQNTIRPSIRNKLQTKRRDQVWDLIDFLLFVDFFVTPDLNQNDFSNIFGDLELRPFYNFSLDLDFSVDQYEGRLSSFNTDIAYFQEGKFRLATAFVFSINSMIWLKIACNGLGQRITLLILTGP